MYAIPSLRGILSLQQVVTFEPFYVRGGSINTYCKSGDSLYIGGNFTEIGKISDLKVNCFSILNTTNASISTLIDFTLFDGAVSCHAIFGNYIYVGGSFSTYNGVSCKRIAKISLINGTADATFSAVGGFDGSVNCIALDSSGNYIYVGGNFTLYGSIPTSTARIAKLDATTGALVPAFDTATGFSATVRSIAIDNTGNLFVGGNFTTYKSVAAQRIAKLNATTAALDVTFDTATGFNGNVATVALDNAGNLFAGGAFTTYKSIAAQRIAKINTTTAARDATFDTTTGFNNNVGCFALDNTGNLFVGGAFTTYKSTNAIYIAKLNATTAARDATFDTTTGFNSLVNSIALDNAGNLFVGGDFNTYKSTSAQKIIKLNATTAARDATFDTTTGFNSATNLNNIVNYIVLDNAGNLFVGGDFTNYKTTNIVIPRIRIAKISLIDGTVDTNFNPGTSFNNTVNSIVMDNTNNFIYVGGAFTLYGINGAVRLAKLNATTAAFDTAFSTTTGFNNTVNCLVLDSVGNLFAGGAFTTYKSTNIAYIAKINATNAALMTPFNTGGFDTTVNSLAMDNSDNLFVGGNFTSYNSTIVQRIAKINTTTAALDATFSSNIGFDASVSAVALDNTGNLFVGGSFTTYKSVAAQRVAKLNATTAALDVAFDTTTGIPIGSVSAMVLDNAGNLFVGGSFTTYKSVAAQRVAKLNATTAALDVAFNSSVGFDTSVSCLILGNSGNLLVGGFFNNYKNRLVLLAATINSNTGTLQQKYNI